MGSFCDYDMEEKRGEKSRAGAFYLAGVGMAVALVGALFVYLLWNSYVKAMGTREWREVSCLVIVSKVMERSEKIAANKYSWGIEYIYDFEGRGYQSDLHTLRASKWTSDRGGVEELMRSYPEGERAVCFVNPERPGQAILEHDSKGAVYSIWFPMLFVVGGLGITVSSLRGVKLWGRLC